MTRQYERSPFTVPSFAKLFLCLGLLLPLARGGHTESPSSPTAAWRLPYGPLRIGYMQPEAPTDLNREWFRGLQRFFETDPACAELRRALRDRYAGFVFVAAEGYNDLVRRMENRELDVVFCPAVAFAQQTASYTAVFQLKGPNDPGGRTPSCYGVIIVNRRHSLYRQPGERGQRVDRQVLARHVAAEPIALVSRYSAAGCIVPLYQLHAESGTSVRPYQPTYCGSSEEVAKMVLSDVISIGICEKGTVEEVLNSYNAERERSQKPAISAEKAVDELLLTHGIPTDPVAFLRTLEPDVARPLRAAIERYFRFSGNRPQRLRLVESDDSAYRVLVQALQGPSRKFADGGARP